MADFDHLPSKCGYSVITKAIFTLCLWLLLPTLSIVFLLPLFQDTRDAELGYTYTQEDALTAAVKNMSFPCVGCHTLTVLHWVGLHAG